MPIAGSSPGLRRLGAALIMLLALAAIAHAAPPGTPRFESLTSGQGLSQDSALAVVQGRQGYIWLGTQSGLNRYDGYNVVTYRHDPSVAASLVDNYVDALYEDAKGRLWVGTLSGLDRYDATTDSFTHFQLPAAASEGAKAKRTVFAIVSDGAGGLWLGMSDGLRHFDPVSGQFDHWLHHTDSPDSLSNDRVEALALDTEGMLWIGTGAGVDRLAPNASDVRRGAVDGPADPIKGSVHALRLDHRGRLWIGLDDGVANLTIAGDRRGEWHRLGAAEGVSNTERVLAIFEDNDGDIWVGADQGVWCADAQAQHFRHYQHRADAPHSLAAGRVVSFYEDRSGVLWIGTWYGGASRIDLASGGFQLYRHYIEDPNSLSNSQVYSVEPDGRDGAWLGTLDGLDHLDLASGEVTAVYRHQADNPASLRSNEVTAVRRDNIGHLWVGTSLGLDRFDEATGRITHLDVKGRNLRASYVEALYRDPAGMIWVATREGIYEIDPASGTVTRTYGSDHADPGSLSDPDVNAIWVDRQGSLWVATAGGGLDRLLAGAVRFDHFVNDPKDPHSLSHNRVQAFAEDHAGTLWVGTAEGLNHVLPGAGGHVEFVRYTTKSGLGADSVGEIQEDDSGHLWISTTAGLSRLDPATGHFDNFSARDGLIDGSYFIASSGKDAYGKLYFGGLNGLTVFQPRDIRENPYPPPLAITDFLIFNRSVHATPASLSAARTLSYQQSVFSFQFSALHFADPQRIRYAYKLDGFDQQWIETDAGNRFATYTNLGPGQYQFHVKAANKDGVWNPTGISIPIVITPPFWMTWWFRGLVAVVLLGIAYAAYRLRIRSLVQQRRQLEREVAERTAEVLRQKETVEQQKEELQKAYQAVEEASLTDPLTGLHNRRFLQQHMESDAALSVRRYVAAFRRTGDAEADPEADLLFFLIDIDHFKSVNDRYGHAAGDQVLAETARRLRKLFRESDYVVRWGGEEFLVVARGSNRSQAERLAERLRATVAAAPVKLEGGAELAVTCSVGFACFPFLTADPRVVNWTQLVDLADHALYAAKHRGRNTWVGLYAKESVRTPSLMERLMRSPQEAITEGVLRLVSAN